MGVPATEVGYTSAMPRREDHEVHKDMWGHWRGGKELNSYGENSFGLGTFRFTNDLQERIKFVNRGLTEWKKKDVSILSLSISLSPFCQ